MEEDPALIMKRFSNLLRNGNGGSLPPILHAAERAFEAAEAAEALARVEATYVPVPGASFLPARGWHVVLRTTPSLSASDAGMKPCSFSVRLARPARRPHLTVQSCTEHTAVPSSASGEAGRGWGLSAPLLEALSVPH